MILLVKKYWRFLTLQCQKIPDSGDRFGNKVKLFVMQYTPL
jgi:hypothetical protein